MNTNRYSRRNFLAAVALTTVASPMVLPSSVFGDDEKVAPSERVTIAHFGVGGLGGRAFAATQQIKEAQSVAVTDCFKSRRESYANACKGKASLDFREVLTRDDVDAVLIITPDHWHVPMAIAAGRAKKHTHIAKPLGLSIEQNLACQKLFQNSGLVFQYGTQQRNMPHCWQGCELVRRGVIGEIKAIEVDAPNGGKGGYTKESPIPPDLGQDGFEMWTGPSPIRPYTQDRCKPQGTYWIYDYSIGYLAGWGAHPLDIMVWGSDADISGTIVVEGTGVVPEEGLYDTVYNWNMKIKLGETDFNFRYNKEDRTRFIGEKGWIEIRRTKPLTASDPNLLTTPLDKDKTILRRTNFTDNFYQSIDFVRSLKNGIEDFVLSIKNKQEPVSTLRDAIRSDNISHLCDIAVRTKSTVKWDPNKLQLIDPTPEQQKLLTRPIRAPWTL
ncbi:MAG: Gfo/Idh/MocA family oxidoreductase [Planctomycetaceae bacterium]|jgi:predicted dehydrogenase|nr:Gfo/Idh/MocA family oxidoreductase [Planctomycetaceae bacterium]